MASAEKRDFLGFAVNLLLEFSFLLLAFTKSFTWNVSRVVNGFINAVKKEPRQKETQSARRVRSVLYVQPDIRCFDFS